MSERTEYEYDVFISYAEADSAWVQGYLLDALEEAGLRCHSEAAFALGVPRILEFERAIRRSLRTLLVLSPAYLSDESNQFVNLLAQSYGLETTTWPVIPLLLRPVELPPRLGMLTSLDATDSQRWSEVIERLCHELRRPVPEPPPRLACPYPGMVPFSARDARFFYGREVEIEQALRHLRHQRFLFIIGSSGSGKSSFIVAGLLPRLQESTFFPAGFWLVRMMRPGSQPSQTLPQILGAALDQPAQVLSNLLAAHPPAQRLLLVLDQFEELFTQAGRSEQTRFIATLQGLRAIESCALVMALRADFYSDLMNSDLWPVAPTERLEIAPLRGAALRDAIVKPAERQRVYLQAGLVESLLADAADEPGVLPLVQETMVQLWDKMERRLIPLSAYEQLGGGGRSGLAAALVSKADATLAQLPPQQQAIARRIFLRLVQFGEGRPDTRRQQPVSALRSVGDDPQVFDQTLRHLTDNRLLTLSGEEENRDRQVDIAHEALFTAWPALQSWLAKWRKPEQTRRTLETWADDWDDRHRDPKALLNVAELSQADEWTNSPAAAVLGYSEALPALIEASRGAIRAAEREKEAAHQRELELERQRAAEAKRRAEAERQRAEEQERRAGAERQRAETERKARVRQRYFTIGLTVLLSVAAILLCAAIAASISAIVQRNVALSRELSASAASQLPVDPELSLLLARQALSVAYTAQAEDTLRQSLLALRVRTVMRGHTDGVNSAAFSPDGKLIVTASRDKTARVWEASTGQPVAELVGHTGSVTSAAFNDDGRFVITVSEDQTARVWDARTGKEVFTMPGYPAAFSPDGKYVVTVQAEKMMVCVWEVATGQVVRTLQQTTPVSSVALSPGGGFVITASEDETALVWEVASGKVVATLAGLPLTFSPDSKFVITTIDGKTARVWEVSTGNSAFALVMDYGVESRAAFSPNLQWGITWVSDISDQIRTAKIWDASTGNLQTILHGHTGDVWSAAFSSDGQYVVTGSTDNTARVWKTATGKSLAELVGHTGLVKDVSFSPDGKRVVTASWDETARMWEPGTNQGRVIENARRAAFSPDGRLVTTTSDGPARTWEIGPGGEVAELHRYDAGFSRDGKWVIVATGERTAQVVEASTGRMIGELREFSGPVWSAKVSPTGKYVVLPGDDSTTRVWEVATGEIIAELSGYQDYAPVVEGSAFFSPDGRFIVGPGGDNTARVWDLATGKTVSELRGHTARVFNAAFSPDGRLVVTASDDTTARVWEASTGRLITILSDDLCPLSIATFSPDSQFVATASTCGEVQVWEANTGRLVADLRGHSGPMTGVSFSPTGRFIVTTNGGSLEADNTARVWDMNTERTLYEIPGDPAFGVTNAMFSPDGKWVVVDAFPARIVACEVCVSPQGLMELAGARLTLLNREFSCQERQKYLHENIDCPASTPTPTQMP